jgi:hypothetical protein
LLSKDGFRGQLIDILLNAKYCEDAARVGNLLAKGNRKPRIKRLFIKSTGNGHQDCNQDVKMDLENNNVLVRYPFEKPKESL